MSYEAFQAHVRNIMRKAGISKGVKFSHEEDGRHIARFSDGTTITGNTCVRKLSVRWGSGHTAQVAI